MVKCWYNGQFSLPPRFNCSWRRSSPHWKWLYSAGVSKKAIFLLSLSFLSFPAFPVKFIFFFPDFLFSHLSQKKEVIFLSDQERKDNFLFLRKRESLYSFYPWLLRYFSYLIKNFSLIWLKTLRAIDFLVPKIHSKITFFLF